MTATASTQTASIAINPRPAMIVAALCIFLTALDQTVIVTALWPISQEMQIPITELDKAAWVVTAYLLGYTVALPLMGRVADVYGQRRIFLVSLGIFMLGSVLCALAPSLGWLVAARGLQAVGGGAILPVGMAMSRHLYGEKRVPFMLGILGAVAEAGGVIGPLWGALIMQYMDGLGLGTFITAHDTPQPLWDALNMLLGGLLKISGWRWIFWVNIPLGVLFAAFVLFTPSLARLPRFPGKIDWLGAGLLGGGLLALSLALATPGSVGAWAGLNSTQSGQPAEWLTPQTLTLFGLAILLFVLFVLWQRRAAEPLIPLDLFARRNWPFAASNLTNLLVGSALIITMVNVPLYVASVLDGSAADGGFMLLRMTAFIPIGAVAGGLLGARLPYRWVALPGLLVAAAGSWEMHNWTLQSANDPTSWLGLALNGLGFGLLISPVTATALQWGGLKRAALSAASVNLSRMIGMMVSLSALTALGLHRFQQLMADHPIPLFQAAGETAEQFAQRQADYTIAYKSASLDVYTSGFLIAALVCLAALVFALWLRPRPGADIESGPIF